MIIENFNQIQVGGLKKIGIIGTQDLSENHQQMIELVWIIVHKPPSIFIYIINSCYSSYHTRWFWVATTFLPPVVETVQT